MAGQIREAVMAMDDPAMRVKFPTSALYGMCGSIRGLLMRMIPALRRFPAPWQIILAPSEVPA